MDEVKKDKELIRGAAASQNACAHLPYDHPTSKIEMYDNATKILRYDRTTAHSAVGDARCQKNIPETCFSCWIAEVFAAKVAKAEHSQEEGA